MVFVLGYPGLKLALKGLKLGSLPLCIFFWLGSHLIGPEFLPPMLLGLLLRTRVLLRSVVTGSLVAYVTGCERMG